MHTNYYFLNHLTPVLETRLAGATLETCFSQNKDELIIGFSRNEEEFYIKAHLSPTFCCLYFPQTIQRARKNSIDLFSELRGNQVLSLRQFLNERCFSILFNDGQQLLFKMQGNRSNIILFDSASNLIRLFNKRLKNDWNLSPDSLDRPLDQTKEAFIQANGDIQTVFPTFGKVVTHYIKVKTPAQSTLEEQWNLITETLKILSQPNFNIVDQNGLLHLSLLPESSIIGRHTDPIEALNDFFIRYISSRALQATKKEALQVINKVLKQGAGYLDKAKAKLEILEQSTTFSQLADVIMANLHQIKTGDTQTTLSNFYDQNRPLTIKLKQNLTPQKNAELYYRKAKNQQKEIDTIKASITAKEEQVLAYEVHRAYVIDSDDARDLKRYLKDHQLLFSERPEAQPQQPFNQQWYEGFHILIGKNAKSNDKMLQSHTYKEDLWLHAKDVSGSHVIIKHQAGKKIPKIVIEYAAGLAAYYSKRKTDSLCPVIVTPRKFVRKRKGDPAGMVVVDKEEVILVEPKKAG